MYTSYIEIHIYTHRYTQINIISHTHTCHGPVAGMLVMVTELTHNVPDDTPVLSVSYYTSIRTVTYSVVVWSHTSMSPLKFDDCTAALQELGQSKASTSGATFCHCFESCRDMVGGITQFYQINQNTKSLNPY